MANRVAAGTREPQRNLKAAASQRPEEACREQLSEVIEEWVLVRVSRGLPIPAIDGITVAVTDGE